MVKGKGNGLTSTDYSVKICRVLPLSSPYWKWSYHNAMQSECAHRLRSSSDEFPSRVIMSWSHSCQREGHRAYLKRVRKFTREKEWE